VGFLGGLVVFLLGGLLGLWCVWGWGVLVCWGLFSGLGVGGGVHAGPVLWNSLYGRGGGCRLRHEEDLSEGQAPGKEKNCEKSLEQGGVATSIWGKRLGGGEY